MLSSAKDIAVTGAALVAAYIGLRGLSAWRRQLTGNAEYQLAKNILACVYELRDRVIEVRSPFMSHSSEPDLPKETLENMSREQKDWHAYAQAYQKRWDRIPAVKNRLDVNMWEAEAVWGKDLATKGLELNRMLNTLLFGVQEHLQSRNPSNREPRNRPDPAEQALLTRRQAVVFSSGSDDKFADELNGVVKDIEVMLRPHVALHYR